MRVSKTKYDLIKSPIITEKGTSLSDLYRKYIFRVSSRANKFSVKKAIEEFFSVKVSSVNILNQKGKRKIFKGTLGRRSDFKKAIVTLEENNNIDFGVGVK